MYPSGAVVGAAPAAAPSAASRVEKATSHLLMGPDWAVNLEICDILNADVWQTKDVVKAVKKRLQNKDPKVQFFALTLLETMMKNCGEYVRFEVAEQHVLQEMVKIIQKKNDMQVRDKILLLLDSWQEAFGGPGSKYPQYHWAYLEVKTTGVVFPKRPIDAPPIFTPPATHNSSSPRYAAGSLSDRMSSDVETLSLGDLNSIRNVTDLLNDMVHALNPSDRTAVNDEIITDLVTQCRSNQQKLLQLVSSTGNEQLLKQGLEINDLLQSVLSKYDAVVSGAPLAVEAPVRETIEAPREAPAVKPSAPPEHNDTADEEEDEFAQLAQRKNKSVVSSDDALSSTGDLALVPIDPVGSESPSSIASNALVPLDPVPSSSSESKELDMINLLSLTLCSPSPETSTDSPTQSQNAPQQPTITHNQNGPQQPTVTDGQQYPSGVPQYPLNYQPHTINQGYARQNSNYVAPWAQTGAYPPQPPAYASGYGYPAPPWAAPAPPAVDSNPFLLANYQDPRPATAPVAQAATYAPPPASYPPSSMPYAPFATPQSIQHNSSVGSPPSNGLTTTQAHMNVNYQQPKDSSAASSRPYYIPDNLFSDLIDVKNLSGGNKIGGPTAMGSSNGGQPMIGGKK
ncbi:hypothetical protein SEVIR_5G370400v4 [Setaria viridis]|uniref:VHS domain-containing protein n=2 Tax=Setaria viridis TaxID=4556 RepID=A0A4V6D797_SETVI|nr:TOM1-like protein 6 isoform X2 [Setaria viridis]TKW17486.1 hypothetical protein SEVIR_5G370400v2 [Setaria viridis]